mmetsp:Transcript_5165/g.18112  ORF Transcript_5165/g.18112 Transcript_5165/m.18112 type:complete len:308 (-) Transcript_5165:1248-2171(-)
MQPTRALAVAKMDIRFLSRLGGVPLSCLAENGLDSPSLSAWISSRASNTSACEMTSRPFLIAVSPLWFIRFMSSAPVNPGVALAMTPRSTFCSNFLPLPWTSRISCLPSLLGSGISRTLSNLPGLSTALSSTKALFVAARTTTPVLLVNPSISARSWLHVCISSDPAPPVLALPSPSNSSMKITQGAFSLASSKRSRIFAAPMPTYSSTNSAPEQLMRGTFASAATALASSVFPVPGWPTRSTPAGVLIPISKNRFGCLKNSTTSWTSFLMMSIPATSLKVVTISLGFTISKLEDLSSARSPILEEE